MAYPFTVDISAFYGEPDIEEQNSSTIVELVVLVIKEEQ